MSLAFVFVVTGESTGGPFELVLLVADVAPASTILRANAKTPASFTPVLPKPTMYMD